MTFNSGPGSCVITLQSITGSTGPQGLQGETGAVGPQGPPGNSAILVWGNNGFGTGINTKYADPFWDRSVAGTSPIGFRLPRSGTLKNFTFSADSAGVGDFTASVRVNDVPTLLSLPISATTTQSVNSVNSLAVNQGDKLDLEIIRNIAGSPTNPIFTIEFE